MTYFAFEGGIATGATADAVEISEQQYLDALTAIMAGQEVTIDGGFALREPQPSEHHVWIDGAWVDETPKPEPEPVDLGAYAAQKRWEKEVGGIEVSGMAVMTDDRSKTLIAGARMGADNDPEFTTKFKAADGAFVTLDATAIVAISNAVLSHVQSCFEIEEQVAAAIAAETITTIAEIDSAFI